MELKCLLLVLLSCQIVTVMCAKSIEISEKLLQALNADPDCLLMENILLSNAVAQLQECIRFTEGYIEKDERHGRNKIQAFTVNICQKRFYENCLVPNELILTKCLPQESEFNMHLKHIMNGISGGLRYACSDNSNLKDLNFTNCDRNKYHVFKSCDKDHKVLKMLQNWTKAPFNEENCRAILDLTGCAVAAYRSCPDKKITKFIINFTISTLKNTPCKQLADKLSQANTVSSNTFLLLLLSFAYVTTILLTHLQ